MVVNLTHVGLPNIVAGKEVIPELLQDDVSVDAIVKYRLTLLDDCKLISVCAPNCAASKKN